MSAKFDDLAFVWCDPGTMMAPHWMSAWNLAIVNYYCLKHPTSGPFDARIGFAWKLVVNAQFLA